MISLDLVTRSVSDCWNGQNFSQPLTQLKILNYCCKYQVSYLAAQTANSYGEFCTYVLLLWSLFINIWHFSSCWVDEIMSFAYYTSFLQQIVCIILDYYTILWKNVINYRHICKNNIVSISKKVLLVKKINNSTL